MEVKKATNSSQIKCASTNLKVNAKTEDADKADES